MLLKTYQPIEVYEMLMRDGVFICDPNNENCFTYGDVTGKLDHAYGWLIERMKETIPRPDGVTSPIWAWYKHLPFEETDWSGKNQKMAKIILQIPDDEVLLTDYDDWHNVLNGAPIVYQTDGMSDEEWEMRFDKYFRDQLLTEATWESVLLDIESAKLRSNVQATFWMLKKEYIRAVRFFETNPTKKNGAS
jgi:hypothetical protein